MNDAERIVDELLDKPVRACAACEQEKGILDRSDYSKSHGTCRKHFAQLCRDHGLDDFETQQEIEQAGPNAFVPEL